MVRDARYRRYDVWTDAGREPEDFFRIARDVSSSAAFELLRTLRRQGWQVRMMDVQKPGEDLEYPRS